MLLFELNKNSVYLINNLNVVLFNDIFRFFLFGFLLIIFSFCLYLFYFLSIIIY